jgi:hypothetical protein
MTTYRATDGCGNVITPSATAPLGGEAVEVVDA